MARTLDVYLNRDLVGQLVQDDDGQMVFDYEPDWLANPHAAAISQSLPLRMERFTQKECRGFFSGILPEDVSRKLIARILQVSDKNDFAMLERIGGECAGAVTFLPEHSPPPQHSDDYREISLGELEEVLRQLDKRPLLAGEKGIRLSLAGVQDKIAVRVNEGKIFLPLNHAPSTHILKPAIATWEGLVANETFCIALAEAAGLPAAATSAHRIGEVDYLLSARYDRFMDDEGNIRRLHQEDFCQALGVPSEIKYQAEGGPGLSDCFAILRAASTSPALGLKTLLDAVVFNLLIGNNDAHAKNYSLLYRADGSIGLAPLYDLVCTVYYPGIENRMAMKIGGEGNPDLVSPGDFERFARETGLSPALVKRRVSEVADTLLEALTKVEAANAVAEKIAQLVGERCRRTSRGFRSGKAAKARVRRR